MTPTGKYYVSILTEYEKEIIQKEVETVVGLDFAMAELYVSSEDEKANYPRFYRQMLNQLAKAQRVLSKRIIGSARWNKQRIRVAKLHEKVANQRKNFLHHKSKELAAKYDAVAIEVGHPQGDKVLQEVANVLKSKIPLDGIACRYRGEEFAVILPGLASEEAMEVAESIRLTIQKQEFYGREHMPNKHIPITIGVSTYPDMSSK
jgi:predicted signal transduction protein with EAL and GGDEF domain